MSLYFAVMGALEGLSAGEILEKTRASFHRAWALSFMVWTPVQLVNLHFVPLPVQPAVVATVNVRPRPRTQSHCATIDASPYCRLVADPIYMNSQPHPTPHTHASGRSGGRRPSRYSTTTMTTAHPAPPPSTCPREPSRYTQMLTLLLDRSRPMAGCMGS